MNVLSLARCPFKSFLWKGSRCVRRRPHVERASSTSRCHRRGSVRARVVNWCVVTPNERHPPTADTARASRHTSIFPDEDVHRTNQMHHRTRCEQCSDPKLRDCATTKASIDLCTQIGQIVDIHTRHCGEQKKSRTFTPRMKCV